PVDPLAPFQVSLITPENQALGVATTPVSATFSAAADPATLTFALRDAAGTLVSSTVSYDAERRRATLTPATALAALADYTARVAAPSLAGDVLWTFRTAAQPLAPRVALALSEGAGASVADNSGNGNTARMANGAGWATGMYGGGVLLDGADD